MRGFLKGDRSYGANSLIAKAINHYANNFLQNSQAHSSEIGAFRDYVARDSDLYPNPFIYKEMMDRASATSQKTGGVLPPVSASAANYNDVYAEESVQIYLASLPPLPTNESRLDPSSMRVASYAESSQAISQYVDSLDKEKIDSTNQCPQENHFGQCAVAHCQFDHIHKKPRDEAIMYPFRSPVSMKCVYPIFYRDELNVYNFVANSVRIGASFLTVKHSFYSKGCLVAPISSYYIKLGEEYSPVLMLELADPKTFESLGNWTWDFVKFYCSPQVMSSTLCTAVTPTVYSSELASNIRMVHYDPIISSVTLDMGRKLSYMGNVVCYAFNTKVGDSGSPLFDDNGRFIGLHKQGNPNGGLTFSCDGKVHVYFLSQASQKNFPALYIK